MGAAPRVVIVGGGFGGLAAARALARAPVEVTLVDRRNHHLFQPLLYQVATAALNPADVSAPIRHVLRRQRNAEVVLGEVTAVDVGRRTVSLADGGEVGWDFLIVASGAAHSYFGRDDWEPFAPGLKTLEDGLEVRRRLLTALERAEREDEAGRRRALLTFAVVGGGPTGVELAGAISEIARRTMAADFRRISTATARVVLLEAAPRLLPSYPPELSESARRQLESLGVEVRTGAPATAVDDGGVTVGGERIEARTVLWCAGVRASPLGRNLGAPLDEAGRVKVQPDLSLPGRPEVLVVGDLASLSGPDGRPVPGLAPAAMQMGRHAARNVRRLVAGERGLPFRYRDRGTLATIGRAAAVGTIGRLRLTGFWAWAAWLLVHVAQLVTFRNRVAVLLQWAWLYLTFRHGARLITDTASQARYAAALGRPPPPVPAPRARGDERARPEAPERHDAPASP